MVKFLDWLADVDWNAVGEWIGGIILILGILGMIVGGGDGNEGFHGI